MKKKLTIFLSVCLLLLGNVYAQIRNIQGIVSDSKTGEALAGVTIIIDQHTTATQTDGHGQFTIQASTSAETVTFSLVGYLRKVVTLSSENNILVTLDAADQILSEVVVTALGIERRKNELGYAAQEVRGEELTRTRDNNFTNALAGKIAGLEIKQSGTMGGSTNVVMRGYKSLLFHNQALFVIDGIPVSNFNTNTLDQTTGRGGYDYGNAASDINPDDIESINVLKGAAASSLYGSRASNGVIMITTKKGKKNSSNITINTGLTVSQIDRSTFPTYQKEYGAGYVNQYSVKGNPSPDGNFWYNDVFGQGLSLVTPFTDDASYGAAFNPDLLIYQWEAFDPSSPNYGKATPWVAAQNDASYLYQRGLNATHSISIDGGGDNTTFRVGYARNDEKGVLPNSKISKNMFNFSVAHEINDKLKVSSSGSYTKLDGLGRYGTGYDGLNPNQGFRQWFQTNADMKDLKDAYDRTGKNITWNWANVKAEGPIYTNNPYWERYKNYQNDTRDRYFGNAALSWKPLEWLDVIGRVSLDGSSEFQEQRLAVGGSEIPEYQRFDRAYNEANYDLLVNFNKELTTNLHLKALVGANMRRNYQRSIRARTNGGLFIPDLYALTNSKSPIEAPIEILEQTAVDGLFANFNLGYRETYFLEGSIRRDQSTTLPPENNSYWYPSLSGSFIFSNLLQQQSWLNHGKFRLNYAEVGADAQALSLYQIYTLNTMFAGNQTASVATQLRNSNLRPERTKSFELGAEFRFLQERIGLDVSYYDTRSTDQIIPVNVSGATGYAQQWVNAGTLSNRGVEISAYVVPIRNKNFSWTLNANFAKNNSKMTEIYEEHTNLQLASFQGGISLNATLNQPYGTLRGVDYVYVNGFEGDKNYRIVGEDGYYLQSAPNQVLGSIMPDWTAGIQNNLKYKDFALSFLIDIKKGGSVFSLDQYYGLATGLYPETAGLNDLGNPQRIPISQGGGVILPGHTADADRNSTGNNSTRVEAYDNSVTPYGYSNNPQAGFVYDASYVKLREVAITYALPYKLFINSKSFKGVDLSLVGRNLWLIHSNVPYADPEGGLSSGNLQGIQSGVYPAVRNFGFNVRVRF